MGKGAPEELDVPCGNDTQNLRKCCPKHNKYENQEACYSLL